MLAVEELQISGLPGRENLLKRMLNEIDSEYDFILIDCPPNIGVFSINALKASDIVTIITYTKKELEYAENILKQIEWMDFNDVGFTLLIVNASLDKSNGERLLPSR